MTLDPHTKALLDRLAADAAPPIRKTGLADARAALKSLTMELDRPDTPGVTSARRTVQGRDGMVPVTAHRPDGVERPPVAVYLHGGGWVRGDAEMYDRFCRYLARAANCLVLNVDYRLAPEHPYPAGLADAYDVVRWAAESGDELNADGARLAVLGDSAGGNFAAAIAHMAADDGVALTVQGLLYPATDLRPESDDLYLSRRTFDDLYYFLDLDRLHWYVDAYLGDADVAFDPCVSPTLAEDLSKVAPAFVLTAGCDILRDEGDAYADKLRAAGVAVEHRRVDGVVHAFMSFSKAIPLALEAQAWTADQLRRALHPRATDGRRPARSKAGLPDKPNA